MSKHKKQFKLLAAGDFHGDKLAAKKLADLAEKENVDLVVLNGDLVEEEDTSGIIGPFVAKNKKVIILPGNHETIATGSLNILEAVKRHQPNCRVFITGSGVQFVNNGNPIKETDDFEANSPYSVARIQSAYAARYYRGLGIKAYVGYLFHHESSLRKASHVGKMVVEAVKRIAKGSAEKIKIGDISVQKEWGFAGDIAEGIFTLMNQDNIFEATIGTGKAYSIKDWIKNCFAQIGKPWEKFVDVSDSKFRCEYKLLVSNPSSILSLGWRPKVDIKTLAKLMLEETL